MVAGTRRIFAFIILPIFLLLSFSTLAQNFSWANSIFPTVQLYSPNPGSMSVDGAGNVYYVGQFSGTFDADPGTNAFDLAAVGMNDVYVAKYDPNGNFVWAKSFGGSGDDYIASIATDLNGNVFLTGTFNGALDFDPGPGTNIITADASMDVFILKLNTSGDFIWVKTISNTTSADPHVSMSSVGVDNNGNVYVYGSFQKPIDVDPGPAVLEMMTVSGASVIIKLDANGNYINSLIVNNISIDAICLIVKGNYLYVCDGWYYLKKYDLDLNQLWLDVIPYVAYIMTVDNAGNIILAGNYTDGTDFDPGPAVVMAPVQPIGFNHDMQVSKLNGNGQFLWVKTIHNDQDDKDLSAVCADPQTGDIYATGSVGSDIYFDGTNPNSYFQPQGSDGFVEKLDANGNFQWVKPITGTGGVGPEALVADDSGNLLVRGLFQGTCDFNPDPAVSYNMTGQVSTYGRNVFLLKLSPSNHITGIVFKDDNNDGIRQVNEVTLSNVMVRAQQGSVFFNSITDTNGRYDLFTDTGSYSVNIDPAPAYYTFNGTPQTGTFNGNIGAAVVLNDFPLLPSAGINDLSISLYTLSAPRAGSDWFIDVVYRNTGTTVLSGTINMQHAAGIIFQDANVVPANYTNPLLSWNFVNLEPSASATIRVRFNIPSNTSLGTLLANHASILPVINDTTPSNNSVSLITPVVASYDPNDKNVTPSGPLTPGFIAADSTYLEYQVRFQNTGNDTAFVVVITDTLQNTLDLSTLKIMQSSHPYTLKILPGNVLEFIFNPILLPDLTTNEPLSHGYVVYRIKPFTNLPEGTEITNKASIYFDFNAPVITNQTSSVVTSIVPLQLTNFYVKKQTTSVQLYWTTEQEINSKSFVAERSLNGNKWDEITRLNAAGNSSQKINYTTIDFNPAKGVNYYRIKQIDLDGKFSYSAIRSVYFGNDVSIVLVPNPATDKVIVYLPGNSTMISIQLFNVNGQLMKTISVTDESVQINLDGFSKGMYTIKLSGKNINEVRKLLVE